MRTSFSLRTNLESSISYNLQQNFKQVVFPISYNKNESESKQDDISILETEPPIQDSQQSQGGCTVHFQSLTAMPMGQGTGVQGSQPLKGSTVHYPQGSTDRLHDIQGNLRTGQVYILPQPECSHFSSYTRKGSGDIREHREVRIRQSP